jgi:hypothetical protein
MVDVANPYEPPAAKPPWTLVGSRDDFRKLVISLSIVSLSAVALATLFDTNETLVAFPGSLQFSPGELLFFLPCLIVAFAAYFLTARQMLLPDGSRRTIRKSLLITIFGVFTAALCFAGASAASRSIRDITDRLFPDVDSYHHMRLVLVLTPSFSCTYSLIYSIIHRIVFRRSHIRVLSTTLVLGIGFVIFCIGAGKSWLMPSSEKAYCVFLTIVCCCFIHINCLAWWLSESQHRGN